MNVSAKFPNVQEDSQARKEDVRAGCKKNKHTAVFLGDALKTNEITRATSSWSLSLMDVTTSAISGTLLATFAAP